MKERKKSWKRIVLILVMCLSILIPNNLVFAASTDSELAKTPSVYFQFDDGRILEADETNTFTLNTLDHGKFHLRNAEKIKFENKEPYFKCSVPMKEGIRNWDNIWVTSNGTFNGYDIRTVEAKVYDRSPLFGGAKEITKFNIKNISSEIEEIKAYVDGKEVSMDKPVVFNGRETKNVKIKGRKKDSTEFIDIDILTSATIYKKSGNFGYNDIFGNIWIESNKNEECIFNITMNDGTASIDFKAINKAIKMENFQIEYPKIAYIQRWNALGGYYVGVTPSCKDDSRETSYYINFNPSNTSNTELEWNALTPEVATHMVAYGNGIIPKKSGIARFEVTSKENPKLKQIVEMEFRYKNPLKSASIENKDLNVKEGEDLELKIAAVPSNATEQRFNWSYSKEGIVKISDSIYLPYSNQANDYETRHLLTALSAGKVRVTGVPYDETGGAKPIVFDITIKENDEVKIDYLEMAKEDVAHGVECLESKSHNKYMDEWNIFALLRSGGKITFEDIKSYDKSAESEYINNKGLRITDYARMMLAFGSMDKTPANTPWEENLVDSMILSTKMEKETLNCPVFALIALDSKNINIPPNSIWTREKFIDYILKFQAVDGSFSLYRGEKTGSVDMTAMALQSLAPYYIKGNENIQAPVHKALEYLRSRIDECCGYDGNACSSAQVLTALTSLNIDPVTAEGFTLGRKNLITNLHSFKKDIGFSVDENGNGDNSFANTQVTYALESYLRFVEGRTRLYDFTDVDGQIDKEVKELKIEKENANKELENYKDKKNYREAQQRELLEKIELGKAEIDKANSKDAVKEALSKIKKALDNIKTDEQFIKESTFVPGKIEDGSGKIVLEGEILPNTVIEATKINNEDIPEGIKRFIGKNQEIARAYDIHIKKGNLKGNAIVTFDLGKIYEDKNVIVKHLKKTGEVESFDKNVKDGKISVKISELSPFVVLVEKEEVNPTDYKRISELGLANGIENLLTKPHSAFGDENVLFSILRGGEKVKQDIIDSYLKSAEDKYNDEEICNPQELWILGILGKTFDDPTWMYDLVNFELGLSSEMNKGSIEMPAYTLIGYDCRNYQPEEVLWDREELVKLILRYQGEDGSFKNMQSDKNGNVNITSIAIQALAPYYKKGDANVKTAVDKALTYMKSMLNEEGGYEDATSCANGIIALTSLGIDPTNAEGFIKGNKNLITALAKFKAEEENDVKTAVNATNAYNSYLLFINNKVGLYDLNDRSEEETKAEELADAKEKAISEIENYKDANDYREEQQKELSEKVSAAKEVINSAENKEEVEDALKSAKSGIDTIKTDTQLNEELKSIKDEAIKDLEQYKENDEKLYGKNEWKYINNYKKSGKKEILNAKDAKEVEKALKVAKERIDNEKTLEQIEKNNQKKANEVIEKIKKLESMEAPDKAAVDEVRAAYSGLNRKQKELVANYDKLINAEKRMLENNTAGYFYLSMEKITIGQGYLVKPVKVPYCKGDNLGAALVRYYNINKMYANTGYEKYGQFYLASIVDSGKLEAEFPEYIKEYAEKNGIEFRNPRESSSLGEFDYSQFSGWVFTVDNVHSPVGASGVTPKDGMVVRWAFTVVGLGSDCWNTGWGDPIIPVAIDKSNVIKAIADFDSNPEKEELLKDNGVKEAYNTLFADSLNWKADQNVLDNSTSQLSESIKAAEKKKAEAEELAVAKEKAVAEMENYKNANDYREEQQKELAEKVSAAKEAINNAENKEGVAESLKAAKSGIDIIKTDAQLKEEEQAVKEKAAKELAEAKTNAIAEIENYKNANDYREEQQKELVEKVSAAKETINNAENKEAVAEFLKAAKSGIDTIKTDAQLNTKENKVVEKLENNKEEISNKDNEKENNIPKTGDGQEVELMLMLGLLSLAGFYATHNRIKKNNA